MSLRPLRTFRIVAQKAHQRAADWIRLLLLQPMTGAIKQSVFLHSRASARSQVAAPTESSTPNLHRATIAQQRVRMEGWRQRWLGSMGTIWKKKKSRRRKKK